MNSTNFTQNLSLSSPNLHVSENSKHLCSNKGTFVQMHEVHVIILSCPVMLEVAYLSITGGVDTLRKKYKLNVCMS